MSDRPGAYLEFSLVGPPVREYGWHPFDEVQKYSLGWLPRDGATMDGFGGAHEIYRCRPYEGEGGACGADLVASCPTFEAAAAANRLLSGNAYYPLWLARQSWSVGAARSPGEIDGVGPRIGPR